MTSQKQKGFTIIELIIVVAVISILASISVIAYRSVQGRGRDAARMEDLAHAKDALTLYYLNNSNWMETGSGCGYNGDGGGWFSYTNGSTYLQSIGNCLKVGGYTKDDIIDPSGGTTSTPAAGYTYMKYHCGVGSAQRVFIYAKLETQPQDTTATDGTCNSTLDSSYGMNYYLQVK